MDSRAICDLFLYVIYITNILNVSDLVQRNAKCDLYGCYYGILLKVCLGEYFLNI